MATPMGSHLIALLWGRCASAAPRAIGTAERSPRRRVLGRSLPQNTEGTNPTERSRSGNSGDAHQRAARGKRASWGRRSYCREDRRDLLVQLDEPVPRVGGGFVSPLHLVVQG